MKGVVTSTAAAALVLLALGGPATAAERGGAGQTAADRMVLAQAHRMGEDRDQMRVEQQQYWAMQSCEILALQFDDAVATGMARGDVAGARAARNEGEAYCNQGEYQTGIQELQSALNAIGVQPKSVPEEVDAGEF